MGPPMGFKNNRLRRRLLQNRLQAFENIPFRSLNIYLDEGGHRDALLDESVSPYAFDLHRLSRPVGIKPGDPRVGLESRVENALCIVGSERERMYHQSKMRIQSSIALQLYGYFRIRFEAVDFSYACVGGGQKAKRSDVGTHIPDHFLFSSYRFKSCPNLGFVPAGFEYFKLDEVPHIETQHTLATGVADFEAWKAQ